jgi:hypothetical protein
VGFVAFDDGLPLDGDGRQGVLYAEDRPGDEPVARPELQAVSPTFFQTMATALRAGRAFDWTDVYDSRPVLMVSEGLARVVWGSAAAAVGRRASVNPSGPWMEVVGVMADVHHDGVSQPAPPIVAYPLRASFFGDNPGQRTAAFVVRSPRVGDETLLGELRDAVRSVSDNVSLGSVQTLDELYARSMARADMALLLLAVTGALALALGVIGVYSVVGYTVAQRRREIGVRLALGAQRAAVRWMFVRGGLLLVGLGAVIGLAAAVGLTRLMAAQLFGVSALDPLTHFSVALVLVASATLASYVSARQASTLDPAQVLRGE